MHIEATDVTRSYGPVTALDGLSLSIPAGSTFGLLGTNGAGKTTLFRLLIGHERPDAGTVRIGGTDVADAGTRIRERIGYLPERVGFPPELTGREVLEVSARVRDLESPDARVDEVLEMVGLADAADRRVEGYSNGMRRRLGLAAALLADPSVLLLDEPTAGLDLLGVATFHRIIEDVRERTNATVLLSSHALSEVDRLCDRVAILQDGQVRSAGKIANLQSEGSETRPLWIRSHDATRRQRVTECCRTYGETEVRGNRVTVEVPRQDTLDLLVELDQIDELDGARGLDGVELREPGLEATFLEAVSEEANVTDLRSDDDGPTSSAEDCPTTDGGTASQVNESVERDRTEDGHWFRRRRDEHRYGIGRAVRQAAVLAETEIQLAIRRRWVPLLIGLFASFGLLMLTFAGSAPGPAGFERIAASIAALCIYLVPLAALAYGYSAVIGPAEDGWLEVIVALPVSRPRVLLGVTLGRATVLAGCVLLGFTVPGLLLGREYGLGSLPAYAGVVLAVTALGVSFLAIVVLASTVAREKAHALGIALLVWAWFVLVHDLLALGFIAAFDLSSSAVTAMVLANPASAYRVLVLDLLGAGGVAGFAGVVAGTDLPPWLLAGALVAWTALPLAAAMVLIRSRTSQT